MGRRIIDEMPDAVTIAQISDLHIGAKPSGFLRRRDRADRLSRCIARLNAIRPDLVLATGDLTHRGSGDEYARLRSILSELEAPVFMLPGNHDDRDALRGAFPDHRYLFETAPHIAYAVDAGPMRIVAVDSTEPRRTGGYLDDARLEWLRDRLEEAQPRPTLLALHHPPFETGVWPMDAFGFVNAAALGELIARNPHVQRVVAGHVHSFRTAGAGNAIACSAPTPSSQWLLVSTPPRALAIPRLEQAGFLLHSCGDGVRIMTRVVRMNGATEELAEGDY